MANSFLVKNVRVFLPKNDNSDTELAESLGDGIDLLCGYDVDGIFITIIEDNVEQEQQKKYQIPSIPAATAQVGDRCCVIEIDNTDGTSLMISFSTSAECKNFNKDFAEIQRRLSNSVFWQRTERSAAINYFQFYSYLSQQQNMMQDFHRTNTYRRAILNNSNDFRDKVVLDVGAGSGILSFFAIQAGAKKVYAIEASNMASYARFLVQANHQQDKISVIMGKVEEIQLPEDVDVIVSEPMGYMLFNERMLESYIHARKWLKPDGKMYPSVGRLYVCPFTDETLYGEQYGKANFWLVKSFHGVDLSSLYEEALKEAFSQPIIDTFSMNVCLGEPLVHFVDFGKNTEEELQNIDIELTFKVQKTGICHGLAFWFDVEFVGSQESVVLSTGPNDATTHWYQVRCLLQNVIVVKLGDTLKGRCTLIANKRQSYDVTIELILEGRNGAAPITRTNTLDLKNPYFRYGGGNTNCPYVYMQSPSEEYWAHLDAHSAANGLISPADPFGHQDINHLLSDGKS